MSAFCPACQQPLPRSTIHVDLNTNALVYEGRGVKLTDNEAAIMYDLLKSAPTTRSRNDLIAAVYGNRGHTGHPQLIDQYVKRLRVKFQKAEVDVKIEAVRNKGYALVTR